MTASGQLAGQVAIVIGGHSGFGEAISRLFAGEGAHVVVAARRRSLADEVAARIGGTGATCDITDDAAIEALVAETVAARGRLDIFVNSAGYADASPIAEQSVDKLRAMIDVQLTGAICCMRHAGNAMASAGSGAFLSISSLTAHNPGHGRVAYSSAKAGVEYATKVAALEYGPSGVRFNAVAASLIETPMTARQFAAPQVIQAMREVTPLGRMGSSDDIAQAALYLCGPMGAYVTGQTLCVDGGASLLALPTAQMYADVARRYQESQAQQ